MLAVSGIFICLAEISSMNDVADYLGLEDTTARKECPLCGSSDGLHVSPDHGDTGGVSCYSCGFPGHGEYGTGAGLYAAVEDVPMSEALSAFGVEAEAPSSEEEANTLSAVQRERQKMKRRKQNTNARLMKVERAKENMTKSERLLFQLCCRTDYNGNAATEAKKSKRNELIDRALNR